jgi:hypothetical protein
VLVIGTPEEVIRYPHPFIDGFFLWPRPAGDGSAPEKR